MLDPRRHALPDAQGESLHPADLGRSSWVPRRTSRCGVAFGSNLGDRLENMRQAKKLLLDRIGRQDEGALCSPVYESAPVGCAPGAESFFNAVAEIGFDGLPEQLLIICQGIEVELGRPERRPRNASRTADLDILYFGDLTRADDTLALPHPRMYERRFVLEPLSVIRPMLVLPGRVETVASLAKNLVCDEPPLRKIADEW